MPRARPAPRLRLARAAASRAPGRSGRPARRGRRGARRARPGRWRRTRAASRSPGTSAAGPPRRPRSGRRRGRGRPAAAAPPGRAPRPVGAALGPGGLVPAVARSRPRPPVGRRRAPRAASRLSARLGRPARSRPVSSAAGLDGVDVGVDEAGVTSAPSRSTTSSAPVQAVGPVLVAEPTDRVVLDDHRGRALVGAVRDGPRRCAAARGSSPGTRPRTGRGRRRRARSRSSAYAAWPGT